MKISTEIHSAAKRIGEEKTVELVAKAGFDPVYGARPLRRKIQNMIEDVIADGIIKGDIKKFTKYVIDYDEGVKIRDKVTV